MDVLHHPQDGECVLFLAFPCSKGDHIYRADFPACARKRKRHRGSGQVGVEFNRLFFCRKSQVIECRFRIDRCEYAVAIRTFFIRHCPYAVNILSDLHLLLVVKRRPLRVTVGQLEFQGVRSVDLARNNDVVSILQNCFPRSVPVQNNGAGKTQFLIRRFGDIMKCDIEQLWRDRRIAGAERYPVTDI